MARDLDANPTRPRGNERPGMHPLLFATLGFVPVLLVGGALAAWVMSRSSDRAQVNVEAPAETKPPVPPRPTAPPAEDSIPLTALAGLWERPEAEDGFPYTMIIRVDGSASLYWLSGSTAQTEQMNESGEGHGSLVVKEPIRRGKSFMAEFRSTPPSSGYSYTMRYDGRDELTLQPAASSKQVAISLRRTGPAPALPADAPSPALPASSSQASSGTVSSPTVSPPKTTLSQESPFGRFGTKWERSKTVDGMPFSMVVRSAGRMGVNTNTPGGVVHNMSATFTALDPPAVGKWFRGEFRGAKNVHTYQCKVEGDRLLLAPSASTNPAKDAVTLTRTKGNTPVPSPAKPQPMEDGTGIPAAASGGTAVPPAQPRAKAGGFGLAGSLAGIVAGVWERPQTMDGYPFRYEIRPDGSSRMTIAKHTTENGRATVLILFQAASLQLKTPLAYGIWSSTIFQVDGGSIGYEFRIDSMKQLSVKGSKGAILTFTRSDKARP